MNVPMQKGDVVKYIPTATVGKVEDIMEKDGRVWVQLDKTGLYYVSETLAPADPSEYKTTSFKEREVKEYGGKSSVDDIDKMERDVDIGGMMPSGGG